LTLCISSVLADHHERRQEDRLQGDDHRQQAVGVLLGSQADPAGEPQHVEVDEPHRPRERGDAVRNSILDALGPLPSVLDESGVLLVEPPEALG
jgi:hypothetical protein